MIVWICPFFVEVDKAAVSGSKLAWPIIAAILFTEFTKEFDLIEQLLFIITNTALRIGFFKQREPITTHNLTCFNNSMSRIDLLEEKEWQRREAHQRDDHL